MQSRLTARRKARRGPALTVAALTAVSLVALTACGSSSSTSPGSAGSPGTTASSSSGAPASSSAAPIVIPTPTVDAAAAALLPAKYKSAGTLRAATDGTYPPNEFTGTDGTTLQGFDIDLGNALGATLGVKVSFANAKFDSILTGITGGRYDWSLSSFTDNKKRQQVVDFVDYFTAGTSILVKKGNPEHINSLTDLCGKNIALESGTVQVQIAQGATCPAGQSIHINQLPDDATARLQVTTGRAVADMNDFPVAEYTAKTEGGGNSFEVVGQQYESAPYGIACAKGTGLDTAVQAALKSLIANGTYAKILAKWDITQGSLTGAAIDGGTGSGD